MAKKLDWDYHIMWRMWEYKGNFYGFLAETREESGSHISYRGGSVAFVERGPVDVDKSINDSNYLGYVEHPDFKKVYDVYNQNERTLEKLRFHLGELSGDLMAFSRDRPPFDWIPFDAFKDINFVARGGFAKFFTARLKNIYYKDTVVVLKNIGKRITGENLNELKTFASNTLSFTFIVYIYGITRDPATKEYAFVLEFTDCGNLRNVNQSLHGWLRKHPEELVLRWIENAEHVAWCLFHLHERNLLHGDFHSHHILQGIVLCDLALTGPEKEQHRNRVRGVIPYMAPETISHGILTKASEVYSLGVILWELSAGRPPFADKDFRTLRRQIVQDNRRETPVPDTPDWYVELYKWCWHLDPAQRPTAAMVLKILNTKTHPSFANDSRIRDHDAISEWLSISQRERRERIEHIPWPGRLYSPPLVYNKDAFRSKIIKTLDAEDTEDTAAVQVPTFRVARLLTNTILTRFVGFTAWEVYYESLETCEPSTEDLSERYILFAWKHKGNFCGKYPMGKSDFYDYVTLVPKAPTDVNKPAYGPNLRSITGPEGNVYDVHDRNKVTLEILRSHLGEEYIKRLAVFPWRRWLDWIPFDAFSDVNFLAKGGFARVFTARLEMWNMRTSHSAVKTVVLKKVGKQIADDNLNELKRFAGDRSSYPFSIIEFYGITQEPTTKEYALVLEFKRDGSIRDFHRRLRKDSSDHNKYWLIRARDVALVLHSFHSEGLLHGDFHSGNILLSSATPILGDINGITLSDLAFTGPETDKQFDQIRGVVTYMAPEYLAHGIFTKASEIYSLGVILWELSAGRPPFASENFSKLGLQIVHEHRRETPVPDTPDWYVELYRWCWHSDAAYRPTALDVYKIVDGTMTKDDPRIRDHPAISKWLSLSLSLDKIVDLLSKIPWPGHLQPPPAYDRNRFTSRIFKTLDTEAAQVQSSSLDRPVQSENFEVGNRFYSENCEVPQSRNLKDEK